MLQTSTLAAFATSAAIGIASQTTTAAPPTEENWWSTMSRYIGDHVLYDGAGTTALGEFSVEWGAPFERLNYRFQSVGDGDPAIMTGFCHWDDGAKTVRFLEVESGPEGLMTTEGRLVDVDGPTLTWKLRSWTERKMFREAEMKDTFGPDGVDRSVKVTAGETMPDSFRWRPLNRFKRAFPIGDRLVGTWTFSERGRSMKADVTWGPGEETIEERTYAIGEDGTETLTATVTYMYDRIADRVRMHFLDANGASAWGTPVIETTGTTTTMDVEWFGRSPNGTRISANTRATLDGEGMTQTVREFRVRGDAIPAGPARTQMTAPTRLVRTGDGTT